MRDYATHRKTAVVFTGSGTAGAYHAGALKALDEAGVKIDILSGSSAGLIAAVFGAAAGGEKLYGAAGFWPTCARTAPFRLRPLLKILAAAWLAVLALYLLPVVLALILGLLLLPALLVDWLVPGLVTNAWANLAPSLASLRSAYVNALAVPTLIFAATLFLYTLVVLIRRGRKWPEIAEALFDLRPGRALLRQYLWEAARGAKLDSRAPDPNEIGKVYAALMSENLGQPGFRELILRIGDLDRGQALIATLCDDSSRRALLATQDKPVRDRPARAPALVDLRAAECERHIFDLLASSLFVPLLAPLGRLHFPKGGPNAGEIHRLIETAFVGGTGLAEAIRAGAEQIVLVGAMPEGPHLSAPRRGLGALANDVLSALDRRAIESEIAITEKINRMVETCGHEIGAGGRAWQDPATGRLYRAVSLYIIRPQALSLGPLEFGGARHPITEQEEQLLDLLDEGYRDTYRLFIEPVVGASPASARTGTTAGAPVSIKSL